MSTSDAFARFSLFLPGPSFIEVKVYVVFLADDMGDGVLPSTGKRQRSVAIWDTWLGLLTARATCRAYGLNTEVFAWCEMTTSCVCRWCSSLKVCIGPANTNPIQVMLG